MVDILFYIKCKEKILNQINDLFIISTSRVTYYASCFGKDICKSKHNHIIQIGFITGLFQLSRSFNQDGISEIAFQSGKLMFETTTIKKTIIIFAYFSSCAMNSNALRKTLKQTIRVFENQYYESFNNLFRERTFGI